MTSSQRIMLFSMFSALAKARGWGSVERDVEREKLTISEFGEPLSWAGFSNWHVDRMKRRIQTEISAPNLKAEIELGQMHEHDEAQALHQPVACTKYERQTSVDDPGERRRLVYVISRLFQPALIRAIAIDLHDTSNWESLPIPDLTKLRDLLRNRLGKFISKVKSGEVRYYFGFGIVNRRTGRWLPNKTIIELLLHRGEPVDMRGDAEPVEMECVEEPF